MTPRFAFFNRFYQSLSQKFGRIVDLNFRHSYYQVDQSSMAIFELFYIEILLLVLSVSTLLHLNRASKSKVIQQEIDEDNNDMTNTKSNPLSISLLMENTGKLV